VDNDLGMEITPPESDAPIFFVELTLAEVEERELQSSERVAADLAAAEALIAHDEAKQSLRNKFVDWGLTPDEIAAIITA
jgi:hypothetical protein